MTAALDRATVDRLRRSCVECGLCLTTCATYLATGDETQSPRGRLLLLGEVLDGRLSADQPEVTASFDHCLGCLACTATCPSGVSSDLLAHLHDLADRNARPPLVVRWLDRRPVLRLLRGAGGVARRVLAALLGDRWRRRSEDAAGPWRRLARLLGTLPTGPGGDRALSRLLENLTTGRMPAARPLAAASARGPRVAVFAGCADQALLPDTARRLAHLLAALGCDVVEPQGQDCCGALASHTARPARAQRLHRRNREAFAPHLDGCDHVVVAAAGCGLELREHQDDLASRIIDPVSLLDALAPASLGSLPLRVAVHDPCHARHGLGVVAAPRRLLARIDGLEVLEPAEPDVCCGSAGVYGVRHPRLATIMGRRKAQVLRDTGCDLVVTTNPGCLGQIADGLALEAPGLPIIPLTDLVWYACFREDRS